MGLPTARFFYLITQFGWRVLFHNYLHRLSVAEAQMHKF